MAILHARFAFLQAAWLLKSQEHNVITWWYHFASENNFQKAITTVTEHPDMHMDLMLHHRVTISHHVISAPKCIVYVLLSVLFME